MKFAKIIICVIGFLGLAAGGVFLYFYQYATTPNGTSKTTSVVWIRPGQTFSGAVVQLQEAGLVKHPELFRWLAYFKGEERYVRAGEYELSASMSPGEILNILVHGQTLLHKVVIPEGATASEIGRNLEKAGLVSREVFLRAVFDPSLVKACGVEGESFEGYLFPETYYFPRGVTAEGVIKKMVAQFKVVFSREWAKRARAVGLATREVTTLASIIEKETAKPEERPLIAAVFLNRLKNGMRLESDPTVIYDIKDFNGNLTRKDLETNTPHNTYRIDGLPPGPIGNPGKASIGAVLYPDDRPYLYFVSKNDGSHHFSSTLSEHNKMVRRYQLRRR